MPTLNLDRMEIEAFGRGRQALQNSIEVSTYPALGST